MYINIDKHSPTPMIKQLYQQIKTMILNGDLKSNERLIASRKLAEELGISRIVVVEAYEMLTTEGYTYSKKGSGTYVSDAIAISRPTVKQPKNVPNEPWFDDTDYAISFRTGLAALEEFPRSKWHNSVKEAIFSMTDREFGYNIIHGHPEFRKTLADYLYKSRGIRCHEDQIMITTGAVQGLFLLFQYFKNIEGKMMIEDPLNRTIREMLAFNGIDSIFQPVDSQGLDPSDFPTDENISCILATPSHQYPLGGSLPISRRIDLIRYARKHNCYIIEDDYDSEYRYDKGPVESLHELDADRVIYLGSFSKVLTPSIRIGYMVLPEELINPVFSTKRLVDIHCPTINQLAMKHFIEAGHLNQHLSKMKKIYSKRRQSLIKYLKDAFGDAITILGAETGIHLVAEFKDIIFTDDLVEAIGQKGVYILRVSDHSSFPEDHMNQLILGYGNLNEKTLNKGVQIIKGVLENWSY